MQQDLGLFEVLQRAKVLAGLRSGKAMQTPVTIHAGVPIGSPRTPYLRNSVLLTGLPTGLTILPISPYLLSPGRYPWLGTSLPYSATSVLPHLRVVLTNLVAFRSPGSIPGPTGTPIYKRRVVTAEPQFGYLVNPVLAYSS